MADPSVRFRFAGPDDVAAIVALLADDALGQGREVDQDQAVYLKAFGEMETQSQNKYLLAVDQNDDIQGCVQISVIAGLSRSGMKRAQLEGIRVADAARGQGIGRQLMSEAHAIAKNWGCGLVQLTTDRARRDALRFYENLGYRKSHHGMKLTLKKMAQIAIEK